MVSTHVWGQQIPETIRATENLTQLCVTSRGKSNNSPLKIFFSFICFFSYFINTGSVLNIDILSA